MITSKKNKLKKNYEVQSTINLILKDGIKIKNLIKKDTK
jgi:hypothetical protein